MSDRALAFVTDLFAEADIRLDGGRPWDLQVRDERFASAVVSRGTRGFGEAYMDGWWECAALDELFCRAARARLDERLRPTPAALAATVVAAVRNLQTVRRARRDVPSHYDLGNDFFAAMLGPTLQYSCACFADGDDLEAAQRRKLDLVARKLRLEPGMRVLDIGCGWGGLARHLADAHGCRVVGLTLSRPQADYAAELCRGRPVEIRVEDYRCVTGTFDRLVSIGMMEHVGYRNYREYMATAARVLANGGLFLCHTIAGNASHLRTDPWIDHYIFPHSMLPSPAQVARAAEGLFVLEDAQNLGPHYDRTLLAWEANFRVAWDRFRDRYGERFGRMWRYYLLSCAGAFRARAIQVFQFVLAKGGVPGGYVAVR